MMRESDLFEPAPKPTIIACAACGAATDAVKWCRYCVPVIIEMLVEGRAAK